LAAIVPGVPQLQIQIHIVSLIEPLNKAVETIFSFL